MPSSGFKLAVKGLLFETTFSGRPDQSALTTWAPAVDIYETENELVLKADLPDVNEKDLDIQVENNMLDSGERKFEQKVNEDNYLRIERTYGSFSRSFSLPSTVNNEAIKADYRNGVLTVELPKRRSARQKPKQVKIASRTATIRFCRKYKGAAPAAPFVSSNTK